MRQWFVYKTSLPLLVARLLLILLLPVLLSASLVHAQEYRSFTQTLLLELNTAGLRVVRRETDAQQNPDASQMQQANRQRQLLAAIREGTSQGSQVDDRPEGYEESRELPSSAGYLFEGEPVAFWYANTGELLSVTRLNEPRLIRAPQHGDSVHESVLPVFVTHFLIKGPIDAVAVRVDLPELTHWTLPELQTAVAGQRRSSGTSAGVVDHLQVLNAQSWQFDLP